MSMFEFWFVMITGFAAGATWPYFDAHLKLYRRMLHTNARKAEAYDMLMTTPPSCPEEAVPAPAEKLTVVDEHFNTAIK